MRRPMHFIAWVAAAAATVVSFQGPATAVAERRANRLIREKSPYLLQHAYNPVDWYPWGGDALARARSESKPIFLSIGYSTCYWCHVMEREVFEDPKIAELMNRSFINIKVDREERPDLDRIYMSALQAMTGSGGWPMSLLLTPELEPFFGGSYIPADRFRELVRDATELWRRDPARIRESGRQLTELLRRGAEIARAGSADRALLRRGYEAFAALYDRANPGFGTRPKFPRPAALDFLLRYGAASGERGARDMALATLEAIDRGGIHDHVGGGFHRYAVDAQWRTPHFEKMLYDQAQLVSAYLDAYQVTGGAEHAAAARSTLDYVLGVLTGPAGGFYSAEDAESAPDRTRPGTKEEGAYYVWTRGELQALLDPDEVELFAFAYGVAAEGKSVLYRAHTVEEAAKRFGRAPGEAAALAESARRKLLAARGRRPRPNKDDKVVAAWNGLMISAMARGGIVLGEPRYLRAAERGAGFVTANLWEPRSGRLFRRWRDGEARYEGTLADYAFLAQGFLDLYEASLDVRWLRQALDVAAALVARFHDARDGGFYDTAAGDGTLLLRTKEDYDGAEPAGNSVAVLTLARLGRATGNEEWLAKARRSLELFAGRIAQQPASMPLLLAALDFVLSSPREIVLAGRRGEPDLAALLGAVHRRYLPGKVVLFADGGAAQQFLARRIPFLAAVRMLEGKATAYVCENYACKLPTTDAAVMSRLLGEK